jgi:hypothetical protein
VLEGAIGKLGLTIFTTGKVFALVESFEMVCHTPPTCKEIGVILDI